MTRIEPNNKIELQKILGLLYLSAGQYLGNREVLKVVVIYNNVNEKGQTLEIVASDFESFKNGQEFFVIDIMIQLHGDESPGVKDNWVNFIIFIHNGKDGNKNIFRDICFYNKLSIGDLVGKDEHEDECFLKEVNSIMAEVVKLPEDILLNEVDQ